MDRSNLLIAETIVSRIAVSVLMICMTWLACYLIYNWRKTRIAAKRAEVLKARARVEQTEVAYRHLEGDLFADLHMELAEQDEKIRFLTQQNRMLQLRLDTILKADPSARKSRNNGERNGSKDTLYV